MVRKSPILTRTSVERRTREGRSNREIIRSLNRCVAGSSIAIPPTTNSLDTHRNMRIG